MAPLDQRVHELGLALARPAAARDVFCAQLAVPGGVALFDAADLVPAVSPVRRGGQGNGQPVAFEICQQEAGCLAKGDRGADLDAGWGGDHIFVGAGFSSPQIQQIGQPSSFCL